MKKDKTAETNDTNTNANGANAPETLKLKDGLTLENQARARVLSRILERHGRDFLANGDKSSYLDFLSGAILDASKRSDTNLDEVLPPLLDLLGAGNQSAFSQSLPRLFQLEERPKARSAADLSKLGGLF